MTIEMLEQERNLARKNSNSERLLVLNDIIAKARAKETAGKTKIELTERLVNDTLAEYYKMLKDGIKQMPIGHPVWETYNNQVVISEELTHIAVSAFQRHHLAALVTIKTTYDNDTATIIFLLGTHNAVQMALVQRSKRTKNNSNLFAAQRLLITV